MEVLSDQLSRKRVFTALEAVVGNKRQDFEKNQLLLSFRRRVHSWKELKKRISNFVFFKRMQKSQFEIRNEVVMLFVCVDLIKLFLRIVELLS